MPQAGGNTSSDVLENIPATLKQIYAGNTSLAGELVAALVNEEWPPIAMKHFDDLEDFLVGCLINDSKLPDDNKPLQLGNQERLAYVFNAICTLLGKIHKEVSVKKNLTAQGAGFIATAFTVIPGVFESWWRYIKQDKHAFFPNNPMRGAILAGLNRSMDLLGDPTRPQTLADTYLPEIVLRAWLGADTALEAATWHQLFESSVNCKSGMPPKYLEELVNDVGLTRIREHFIDLIIDQQKEPPFGMLWPTIFNISMCSYKAVIQDLVRSEFTGLLFTQLWTVANDLSKRDFTNMDSMLTIFRNNMFDVTPFRYLDLLSQHDLVPLLARMLYLYESEDKRGSEMMGVEGASLNVKMMADIVTNFPDHIKLNWTAVTEPVFLPTLAALRSLSTPTIKESIAIWIAFGKASGVNVTAEAFLSSADVEQAREVSQADIRRMLFAGGPMKPLVGCSWEKCVFFGAKSDRVMLRCFGCGRAQYCAIHPCQKRAWTEGRHHKVCKRKKP